MIIMIQNEHTMHHQSRILGRSSFTLRFITASRSFTESPHMLGIQETHPCRARGWADPVACGWKINEDQVQRWVISITLWVHISIPNRSVQRTCW